MIPDVTKKHMTAFESTSTNVFVKMPLLFKFKLLISLFQDFIPYQLTHCEVTISGNFVGSSNVETVWVLLGSDNRAHVYVEDPLSHSYVDAKDVQDFRGFFPELDRIFPSVPVSGHSINT